MHNKKYSSNPSLEAVTKAKNVPPPLRPQLPLAVCAQCPVRLTVPSPTPPPPFFLNRNNNKNNNNQKVIENG